MIDISRDEIEALCKKLREQAAKSGYYLNPDTEVVEELVEGLLINEKRYGYQACPCRLADGEEDKDLDIICPCDYRDADLDEFNTCYCSLYVSKGVSEGRAGVKPIPERRPGEGERVEEGGVNADMTLKYPVWRCKVCGYLCARDNPPGVCPICKAAKERFERFL